MSRLFYPQLSTSSGFHQPFGATYTKEGTNFALYSAHATKVQLLIWEREGLRLPTQIFDLSPTQNKTGHIWHILVKNLLPRARYAYRLDGPDGPEHRFDNKKAVVDPYAKALDDDFYSRELACYEGDNLGNCLRGIVLRPDQYDWGDDNLPRVPVAKTVIYELHVKGFTRHPSSQTQFPGTFAALQEKLPYLKDLGVTSIELMPILAFDDDIPYKNEAGEELTNYWGYSPLSFFALHQAYFSRGKSYFLSEFKNLVKKAHALGLEIILDVVYNHTTESDHQGPIISWRGIDNAHYYLLSPHDKKYNMNLTGCGNTVSCNQPMMAKMIVDSLEYLAQEFHVDGFRFDLGSIFYYDKNGVFTHQPLVIKLINESPILRQLKLIAEPWDAAGLVLEGRFGGPHWFEWNGSFRDRLRKFVNFRQEKKNLYLHLVGEAPEFKFHHKKVDRSINFVTAHDGFTLRDLVSYDYKHNEENGFHNTDGSEINHSHNYGVEGETDNQKIINLRQKKALEMLSLASTAPGPLMLLMGDEMWRTQGGNNNAFCQDNSISWLNWDLLKENYPWWLQVKNLIATKSETI